MKPEVSVVIVTKNRQSELSQCIGSLLANTVIPDEIVVVDNNSSDNTRQLIEGLQKSARISIVYDCFVGSGYPTIYNRGISQAKYNWVAFIDDDCIASSDWMSEIKKTIVANQNLSALMGWCGTYYEQNVYSQVTLLFDTEWKERSIEKNIVIDFEVLDNKNVVYNKQYLQKNNLLYDESRVVYQNGAAEDCDLGIQIQNSGGNAIVNRKMMIWHKDPTDWLWCMKKNIASWKAYKSLSYKWNMAERSTLKSSPTNLSILVASFAKKYHLNTVAQLKLFFVAKQILLLNRCMALWHRVTKV